MSTERQQAPSTQPPAGDEPGQATGRARGPFGQAVGLAARHKVISVSIALFAIAVIAVSLLTSPPAAHTSPSAARKPSPTAHAYPLAPGFTVAVLGQSGKKISLSDFKGKPVIVNFWASWCEPCQNETPLLASWYKQQHGHVIMIGLDENDSTASALKFAHAKGVTYSLGSDPTVTVASAYGVTGLPQTFFLNSQHRIVKHVLGAATKADLAEGLRLMNSS